MAEQTTRLFVRAQTRLLEHRDLIVEHAQEDAERGSILAELAYGAVMLAGFLVVGGLVVNWATGTANSLPTP